MTTLAVHGRLIDTLRCPNCHRSPLLPLGLPAPGQPDQGPQPLGEWHLRCEMCSSEHFIRQGIWELLTPHDKELSNSAFGKWAAMTYDTFAARGAFRRAYRWHFEQELREFLRQFPLQTDDLVVDVGCGTGNYTIAFAKRAATGVTAGLDISPAMLQLLRRHAVREKASNAVAIWGNALNLPFRDASVPKLFAGCLHHLRDIGPALQEAYRSLAPGGILFGSTFFASGGRVLRMAQRAMAATVAARPVDPVEVEGCLKHTGFREVQVDPGSWRSFFFGTFRALKP